MDGFSTLYRPKTTLGYTLQWPEETRACHGLLVVVERPGKLGAPNRFVWLSVGQFIHTRPHRFHAAHRSADELTS